MRVLTKVLFWFSRRHSAVSKALGSVFCGFFLYASAFLYFLLMVFFCGLV